MSRAQTPTVVVRISPGGEVRIEADGYTGSSCEEATRYLEEALGTASGRTRKAEFYRRSNANTNRNEQNT